MGKSYFGFGQLCIALGGAAALATVTTARQTPAAAKVKPVAGTIENSHSGVLTRSAGPHLVSMTTSSGAGPLSPVGQDAFRKSCARCHEVGELPGRRAHDLQVPERRAALDQFLSRHYARDPGERAAIVKYLAG